METENQIPQFAKRMQLENCWKFKTAIGVGFVGGKMFMLFGWYITKNLKVFMLNLWKVIQCTFHS
jgi:hypothetical protein